MQCYVQKLKEMTKSAFYARIVKLNNFLSLFLSATQDSKLSEEELIEILEFALPNTWQMHMTPAHFVCSQKSPREILNHCKEIEALEAEHCNLSIAGVYNTRIPKKQKPKGPKQPPKQKQGLEVRNSSHNSKVCPIHGPGYSADECYLLKNAIANGKKDYLEHKNKHKWYDKKFTTKAT